MTNGAGEESRSSVRDNLLEVYEILRTSGDIPEEVNQILKEKTTKLIKQVSRIHDNLEEAEILGWNLDDAMDKIGDELYFDGVYVDEV